MYHIKAIGTSEFILGFRLAGVPTLEVKENPQKIFQQAMQEKELGIIITDEKTMSSLPQYFREEVERNVKPVTVTLSEDQGAQEALRKQIQKSIGVDLWEN